MVFRAIWTGSPPRQWLADAWRSRVLALLLLGAALPTVGQVEPLPPDKAFRFTARALDPQSIEVSFSIAEGYYLYREKIHFSVEPAGAGLTVPPLPQGKVKEDPFFGSVETYRGSLRVDLHLKEATPGQTVMLQAESQGCADIGICYPPQVQRVSVRLPSATVAPTRPGEASKKTWLDSM